ncbi:MAG: phosphatase PAP2 family protein [Rubrivivax sp.]|nr:phosphatase PAP2 family protein [Rubrivivax sp.]
MGTIRSYYATPWELRWRPWSLDITPDDAGNPPFPHKQVVNPYGQSPPLVWTSYDWDPALRFWSLPFDPQLTEWLRSVDPSRPSILAAREFAAQPSRWDADGSTLKTWGWLEDGDLAWQDTATGWPVIRGEIEQLQQLMQDDRDRYLAEAEAQADGLADYVLAFVGASRGRHPWTVELVSCGLAIGNVAYMRWKSRFGRVRPSTLCAGLVPPFGPPAHPAFPSGHSTLGHLLALFLLEIPALRQRFGLFDTFDGTPGQAIKAGSPGSNPLPGTGAMASPLLWLAARLAQNRERIGVHYPSDSSAGRHLAAGLWRAMLHDTNAASRIDCPTLRLVLDRARAEWPTPW